MNNFEHPQPFSFFLAKESHLSVKKFATRKRKMVSFSVCVELEKHGSYQWVPMKASEEATSFANVIHDCEVHSHICYYLWYTMNVVWWTLFIEMSWLCIKVLEKCTWVHVLKYVPPIYACGNSFQVFHKIYLYMNFFLKFCFPSSNSYCIFLVPW